MTEDTGRPLGEWLRQRRQELDISLEKVEEDTRIRVRYLEALEADDFEALPDPVVGRGFLRNYAAYLDLDTKEAADRCSELVTPPEPDPDSPPVEESSPSTPEPFRPVPLHEIPGQRSRRGWLIGLLVVLVAALSLLGWWGYPHVAGLLARSTPVVRPSATQRVASADLRTATHTPTSTHTAIEAPETLTPTQTAPTLTVTPTFTPSPSPPPSPSIYTGIFVELVFTDTSWLQITVDGVRQFQGVLEIDTYRSWYGKERVELRIGNAGVVEVTVNGQKMGALGKVGEVVDRVFEIVDEELTEIVPTLTPTPETTVTPSVEPPTPEVTPTIPVTPTSPVAPTTPVTPTASP